MSELTLVLILLMCCLSVTIPSRRLVASSRVCGPRCCPWPLPDASFLRDRGSVAGAPPTVVGAPRRFIPLIHSPAAVGSVDRFAGVGRSLPERAPQCPVPWVD